MVLFNDAKSNLREKLYLLYKIEENDLTMDFMRHEEGDKTITVLSFGNILQLGYLTMSKHNTFHKGLS